MLSLVVRDEHGREDGVALVAATQDPRRSPMGGERHNSSLGAC